MHRTQIVAVLLTAACGGSAKQPAPAPTVSNTEPPPAPPAAEPAPPPPPPPAPTPSDAEFDAMMAKAVTMFAAMGQAADAAGGDCAKAGDGLIKVLDEHKAFIESAKQYKDDETMKTRGEEWMKAHMSEIMEPMMKIGTLGQKCGSDPKFKAAMERFEAM